MCIRDRSFFATYKKELIHTRPWNDLTDVRQHTFLWIEGHQGDPTSAGHPPRSRGAPPGRPAAAAVLAESFGGARPVGSTCTLQVALDGDSSSELRLLPSSSVRHSLPVQGACPSILEDPDGQFYGFSGIGPASNGKDTDSARSIANVGLEARHDHYG